MVHTNSTPAPSANTTAINLSRLLSRLETTLLSPEASSSPTRITDYDRTRIGKNLEYARTLLLRLEQENSGSKAAGASRERNVQADLRAKKQLIKRLNERLYELSQLGDDYDDDLASSEAEDLLKEYLPHAATQPTPTIQEPSPLDRRRPSTLPETSQLRSRHGGAELFTASSATTSSEPVPNASLATSETLLSHQRTEQETLTDSLLEMAAALKNSSKAFASSLESEKDVLSNTGANLEKNSLGMEAAERRIGSLRRMTEGKGWWGRMMMYAWIAGLMVIAILIVGVLPKLRF
ncbi:MAG: hypothetical protein M1824_001478 [Vezdaea acicularis]|nr:MAG: hypothetical protein M1824_001478 [Vezdaea acicularis]